MRVSTTRLRRIALRHQGLTGHRRLGTGLKGARQVIKQLGYIQIDTISVVARAHHHTLWSRVSGYRDDYLNTLVRQGDAFEYWGHAAAYLPMRDYRYSLVRKHAIKRGERHWARSSDQRLMHYVLDRIHAEGPLKARDFDDARTTSTGWWDWKPAKRALEQLYMQGDLMSAGRDGFEKRYDLPERLLPADVATTEPTTTEYATHLVDTTLRAHGITTAQSVTYGRPGTAVRAAVRQVLAERLAAGSLTRLDVDGDHFLWPARRGRHQSTTAGTSGANPVTVRQCRYSAQAVGQSLWLRLSARVLCDRALTPVGILLPALVVCGPIRGSNGLQGSSREWLLRDQSTLSRSVGPGVLLRRMRPHRRRVRGVFGMHRDRGDQDEPCSLSTTVLQSPARGTRGLTSLQGRFVSPQGRFVSSVDLRADLLHDASAS